MSECGPVSHLHKDCPNSSNIAILVKALQPSLCLILYGKMERKTGISIAQRVENRADSFNLSKGAFIGTAQRTLRELVRFIKEDFQVNRPPRMSWVPSQSRQDRIRILMHNRFRTYREGTSFDENNPDHQDFYQQIPIPGSKDKFDIDAYDTERFIDPRFRKPWRRCQALKEYFADQHPELRYNKCLGWGGNGMAAVFDDLKSDGTVSRSVVVKMVFSDNPDVMEDETDKCGQHILQMLYDSLSDDSNVKMDDNGGEASASARTGDKRPAGLLTGRPAKRVATGQPKLNCFITEMLEHGDLAHFIAKVRSHNEKIPNAVLWRFLLCLVRMCIGLAYPPTSINQLKDLPAPITEVIPDDEAVTPRRVVHFDFDPRNIFIGKIGVGKEHDLTPLLKLGDFGLAAEVLFEKEDFYYERFRHYGKRGYYAPEQFCLDWDYIEPDSGTIHEHPIAGNYGIHTNLWAVGLVMETLITLCYPASPPTPRLVVGQPPEGQYITYGGHLQNRMYSDVDRDLIDLIMRLEAHEPVRRPKLQELDISTIIQQKGNLGKTDEEINAWFQTILYDVPPNPEYAIIPNDANQLLPPALREIIGVPPPNMGVPPVNPGVPPMNPGVPPANPVPGNQSQGKSLGPPLQKGPFLNSIFSFAIEVGSW
ncbi:hypothetical protein EKO27_g6840 [Xylaria grammica]|uniref:Protein kinase domain-containing protein n=1 Tax=Xylaria grammica TaxID=363999 RepID=A0A439D1E1_9PEZI|nr:hypothetical protein EKO27_g6840 [Xylaria grammica]